MPEKHPKRPRDLNQRAKRMVDLATGNAQELCVSKIRFCNIGDEDRRGQVAM